MNKKNKKFDNKLQFSIAVIAFVFSITLIGIILADNIYTIISFGWPTIWFASLGFFSTETSLCFGIVAILLFINPKFKMFKDGKLLISTTYYLCVAGGIWIFFILPINANTYRFFQNLDVLALTVFESVYIHVIMPIIAMFCVRYFVFFKQNKIKKANTKKFMLYVMVYPSCYLIYAMILPFVSNGMYKYYQPEVYSGGGAPTDYVSVYGPITDFRSEIVLPILTIFVYPLIFFVGIYIVWNLKLDKTIAWKEIKIIKSYFINKKTKKNK